MATTKATELGQLGSKLTVHNNNITLDGNVHGQYAGFDSDFTSALSSNISVTGNIAVTGTVDGRDVAADGTKLDGIEAAATADQTAAEIRTLVGSATNSNVFTDSDHSKLDGIEAAATADQTKSDIEGLGIDVPASNLTGTVPAARLSTAVTQAESDDSTKIATTAYVVDKITTLIGGAPSTLNDLNELAAAINDDANYNSTLTTALATKLPLAGGTMTGNLTLGDNVKIEIGSNSGGDLQIYHDGNSKIADVGGGKLELHSDGTGVFIQKGATEYMAKFETDGAVTLYHDNSPILATTATGITVTGVTTSTGFSGKIHPVNGTTTNYLSLKDSNELNFYNSSNVSQTLHINYDGGDLDLAGSAVTIKHSGGNVGIGTSNPQQLLHIHNSSGDFGAEAVLTGRLSTGTPKVEVAFKRGQSGDGAMLVLRSSNSSGSLIDAVTVKDGTGNVGIGTVSPAARLHLDTANNGMPKIRFTHTNSGGDNFEIGSGVDGVSNGGWCIRDIDASANRLVIRSDGKVGIGTAVPGQQLTVAGAVESLSGQGSVAFYSTVAGSYNQQNGTGGTAWAYGSTGGSSAPNTAASTTFGFHHWNGSAWSNPLNLTTAGNVGIGTASPERPLHVKGANAFIRVESTSTSQNSQLDIKSTAATWSIGQNQVLANTGTLEFYNGSSSPVVIKTNGNVGIGTTNPDAKMHLYTGAGTTLFKAEVNANSTVGMEIKKTGSTTQSWQIADGITHNGALQFYDVTDSAVRMHIDGDGNVGIGATTLNNFLHIKSGASGGPQIELESSSGTANSGFIGFDGTSLQISTQRDMVDGSKRDTGKSWGGINIVGEAAGSKILFTTSEGNNNNATTKMTISKEGYVGIGITTPENAQSSARDLVIGNGSGSRGLTVWSGTSNSGNLFFARGSSGSDLYRGYIQFNHTADLINIGAGADDRLQILGTGYINATSASQVRLTLGNQGSAGTNNSNWIRGTGSSLGLNAAANDIHFEIGGAQVMEITSSRFKYYGNTGHINYGGGSFSYANQFQMLTTEVTPSASGTWMDVCFVSHSPNLKFHGMSVQSGAAQYGGARYQGALVGTYGSVALYEEHKRVTPMNGGDVTNIEYRYLNSGGSAGSYRLQMRLSYTGGSHKVYTVVYGNALSVIEEDGS